MTPPTVPGYILHRFLGGGTSFQVWEGRAADSNVPVAVKLPRPEALERTSTLTLLCREARAGVAARHPRLVKVLQHHVKQPPYFVVLELVPGESLKYRIKQRGHLSVRAAVWAVRQAAEGLAALHRVGLVHADIKSGNVLLDHRGVAKLIDLGFAHKPGENRDLIKAGCVMGTAAYLAPELCRLPQREGPAADVFALGVTLFECLTGRLPYPKADTADEAIRQRATDTPADLEDFPGEWPSRLLDVVRSMLEVDPADRPPAVRVARELVRVELDVMRCAAV